MRLPVTSTRSSEVSACCATAADEAIAASAVATAKLMELSFKDVLREMGVISDLGCQHKLEIAQVVVQPWQKKTSVTTSGSCAHGNLSGFPAKSGGVLVKYDNDSRRLYKKFRNKKRARRPVSENAKAQLQNVAVAETVKRELETK